MSSILPDYRTLVQDGDMVLCRVNAPLVSEAFKFLRRGIKATILGRDVAAGLAATVKKLCKPDEPEHVSIASFLLKLEAWLDEETQREQRKPNPSESKLIALTDRHDCLACFAEEAPTAAEVIAKIESVFTDNRDSPGIRLASIHKSKGLEARRVFLLEPDGATVPHPLAKSKWQKEQEQHLRYVAITRAIEELTYVS